MDIARLRLHSQQLATPAAGRTAAELVKWFGAVQGQEYAPTKWSLGLRLPHLCDADIEQELADGKILRTHLLRPTWHFVAAEDIRWLLTLTAPRVHQVNAGYARKLGIDPPLLHRCEHLIFKHLENNQHLTREELGAIFTQNNIAGAEGQRLSYVMMWAELEGIVCSGVRQGNQQTYALLEERAAPVPEKTRDEALAELTRRYFQSRSPATAKDFATWSGLTLTDCRRGIEMCSAEISPSGVGGVDGVEYFMLDSNHPSSFVPHPALHLLSIYDEYGIGYKDRSPALLFVRSLPSPPSYRFDNMIVYDGQIVGTWRRDMGKTTADLVYQFFQTPDEQQLAQLEQAAGRFGEFFGMSVTLHPYDPGSTDKLHRPGWIFMNR